MQNHRREREREERESESESGNQERERGEREKRGGEHFKIHTDCCSRARLLEPVVVDVGEGFEDGYGRFDSYELYEEFIIYTNQLYELYDSLAPSRARRRRRP